ncbi:MAG: hypothetical protein K8J08_22235, partial [Thermoanaerobaculia bacterium]|nr:hypothetical protein [Thermoanaerobaculia bacterium]
GGAVELYSGGAYRTDDLDFVGTIGRNATQQLLAHGFRREGRHWIHEEHQIFLEFPSAVLAQGETAARIDFGNCSVLVIGLEELIVDRLAAWWFWRSDIDGMNAFLLLRAQATSLDFKRLNDLAIAAEVGPALDALELFVARLGSRQPEAAELEEWASRIPSRLPNGDR